MPGLIWKWAGKWVSDVVRSEIEVRWCEMVPMVQTVRMPRPAWAPNSAGPWPFFVGSGQWISGKGSGGSAETEGPRIGPSVGSLSSVVLSAGAGVVSQIHLAVTTPIKQPTAGASSDLGISIEGLPLLCFLRLRLGTCFLVAPQGQIV